MITNDALVAVGVDGAIDDAGNATAAIEVAAWEATKRRVPLQLVCGYPRLTNWTRPDASDGANRGDRDGIRTLDRIVAATQARHPGLSIRTTVVPGTIAGALVTASANALLVVVPAEVRVHHGALLGGFASEQVSAHAHATVIVVPAASAPAQNPAQPRRVVVGTDGSAGAGDAMEFAFDEAHGRSARVDAVYVWDLPTWHGFRPLVDAYADIPALQAAADQMLTATTERWRDKYPDVPVTHHAIRSSDPIRLLVAASVGAELTVVGPRGHGGFAGLLVGSVTDGLVRYAHSPVAVVRTSQSGDNR